MNPSFSKFVRRINLFIRMRFLSGSLLALMLAAGAIAQEPTPAREPTVKPSQAAEPKPAQHSETPRAATADPAALITIQEGQLPIILSAPHGGQLAIAGAELRQGAGLEAGPSGFRTVRDVNTDRLALDLSAAIEAKTGKKPYLVVAKFARKYADVNRPSNIGYEAASAKPVYETYHQTLARFCQEVQRKWGRGLLLDIHGQGAKRDTIFRGTGDGKSVGLLVERYGNKARNGPESFAGLLTSKGCKIYPTDDSKEQSGFTGGYITLTYGSHKYGMDAIQLEFGADYTNKDKRQDTAAKLADAIADFSRLYLPAAPVTPESSKGTK